MVLNVVTAFDHFRSFKVPSFAVDTSPPYPRILDYNCRLHLVTAEGFLNFWREDGGVVLRQRHAELT
jgi:hypothetical protein